MLSPFEQMQEAEKIISGILAESREAASARLMNMYNSMGAQNRAAFVAVLINRAVVSEVRRRMTSPRGSSEGT